MVAKGPTIFTTKDTPVDDKTLEGKPLSPGDLADTEEAVRMAHDAVEQLIALLARTLENPRTGGNVAALQEAAAALAELKAVIADHPLTPDLKESAELDVSAGIGFTSSTSGPVASGDGDQDD